MIKTKTVFVPASASDVPSFDNSHTSRVSFDLKDFSPTLLVDGRLFLKIQPVKLYLSEVDQELKDMGFSEREIKDLLDDFQRKIAVQSMIKSLAERME